MFESKELLNKVEKTEKLANLNKGDIAKMREDIKDYQDSIDENQRKNDERFEKIFSFLENYFDNLADKNDEDKAVKENPIALRFEDVVKGLNGKIRGLTSTKLKYHFYKLGFMDLKINKVLNTYRTSNNALNVVNDVKNHIIFNGTKIFTFKPTILDYLEEHFSEVLSSVEEFDRKRNEYEKSRDNIKVKTEKAYREEIHRLCGIKDNYNGARYGILYSRYTLDNPKWLNEYEKAKQKSEKESRNLSKLTYILRDREDGDALSRIAIELFC